MTIKGGTVKGLGTLLVMLVVASAVRAAPPGPCEGPNKRDPGCPGTEVQAAAVVDSVTVDWFNQLLRIRGSGFVAGGGGTSFLLGGNLNPLVTSNVTDTRLDIAFSSVMADEVLAAGNYSLTVDDLVQLSVYIESQIIDPTATACPCSGDWLAELDTLTPSLWGGNDTQCIEIEGPGTNDVADISGTLITDPLDNSVYPHYPIGASFHPGDPDNSVCRLVQVNADASISELVNKRVNEATQAACAEVLKVNVCTLP
ncbi:MAG: hypothetical protein JKX92_04900 [Porticoccaceae bacterium]|nr:hypothetical protein [Porticoccaceae bacterium]